MNDQPPLILERHGKVLEITMNRPPVNAINAELSELMYEAFRSLRDDPDLTLGLITGSGTRCFSMSKKPAWDARKMSTGSAASVSKERSKSPAMPG